MKIFLIDGDRGVNYAWFGHLGTWSEGDLCQKCGQNTEVLIEPLQVEWFIGSDVIADFSWCGYTFVVLDRVKIFLTGGGYDCRFERVEVVGSERKRRFKNVPYPYTGPDLHWVVATARVPLNELKSGVTIDTDCDLCGQKRYTFKREDIVIDKTAWQGQKMFLISQNEVSGATFVTEEARDELISQGFSNIVYLEAGKIV